MRQGRSVFLLALFCLVLSSSPVVSIDESAEVVTHALLINGGSKPASNYLSHLNHLQEMVERLERRGVPLQRIHVFSADGEEEAADLAVRDALPAEFWLIEGSSVGKRLKPKTEVTDTRWPGVTLHPARKSELSRWFEWARKELVPGDELLLFVTDHGTKGKDDLDNGAISLWQEKLTVEDLRSLLTRLPPGVRVVMVMSQCYSGTFANAIYEGAGEPSGDVCGFFSTTRDLKAYGCYPEGRDRDRLGHAFRFIDALERQENTTEAHLELLLTDGTPDVPLRTSDAYMERLVAQEAERQGSTFESLVDSLLAEAWRDRAAWEPEIRLLDRIGDAFGTFSPRDLAELEQYRRDLPRLSEQMKTYAQQWKNTLIAVKQENLRSFASESAEWRQRLGQEVLKQLDADGRKALLAELLPELEWYARDHPERWQRLEELRGRAKRASEARWRMDVRQAALSRMRSILVGIAGQVLLEPRGEATRQRQAFEELLSCEAMEPGGLPPSALTGLPAIEPYPPLADELALLEEVLPSWLGVRFGPLADTVRAERDLSAGATLLQAVYPDSPALEGGLEAGDIVLGPPEAPFNAPGQLREWTFTSPRETPLQMVVVRPGVEPENDVEFQTTLFLRPYPLEWPELPGPPQVGDLAPVLPSSLRPVDSGSLLDVEGRPHLLFFWATWCLPCKKAVPELMAFAAARGIPVLAISDEEAETVSDHLERHDESFFEQVAVDPLRRSFITYGVSGTPTIVLVDEKGVVRHRQVGYKPADGLTVEGWSWAGS